MIDGHRLTVGAPLAASAEPGHPVPILTYHSLDLSQSVISTRPDAFRRQMVTLREQGCQGLSLGELLDGWDGKASLPPRPVVICFDDGFANLLDHGAPLLRELGFRASIFVVAGYCGQANDWPTQARGVPRLPLLSWSALRELAGAGFEVGSHSITHPRLRELSDRQAEQEIVGAKHLLEQHLGRPVQVFAYPYGQATRKHREITAAAYRAACGVTLGKARASEDRYRLRRIDMYYFREWSTFRFFGTPLGDAYLGLRAVARALRNVISRSGGFPDRSGGSGDEPRA